MSKENVERLRSVYERWAKGDFRAGGELFDDEVVFRTFEAIEDEDLVVHGKEGVTDCMRRFLQQWDDLRIEARDFIVSGDKILVEAHQSARGELSGAEVEMDLSHVWTFRRGRATEFRTLRDRRKALEAVGPSTPPAAPLTRSTGAISIPTSHSLTLRWSSPRATWRGRAIPTTAAGVAFHTLNVDGAGLRKTHEAMALLHKSVGLEDEAVGTLMDQGTPADPPLRRVGARCCSERYGLA